MINLGVIPSPGILYSDPHSKLGEVQPIHAKEHFWALIKVSQHLQKAALNPRHAKAGCPRNGSYSALNEVFSALKKEPL